MSIKINFKDFALIPNILSVLRILLIIPVVILFYDYHINKILIITLGIIAVLLDNLDGFFARRLNQISDLGKILDPIADKLLIAIFTIGLYFNGLLPFWFLCVIILRDFFIIVGSIYFANKIKRIIPSDTIGKITAFIIFITLFISIIDIDFFNQLKVYFYIITSILIFINLSDYYVRVKKSISE